jgi:hypothetical protein
MIATVVMSLSVAGTFNQHHHYSNLIRFMYAQIKKKNLRRRYVASKVVSFNVIPFCLFAFIQYLPVFRLTLEMSTAHIYFISLDTVV